MPDGSVVLVEIRRQTLTRVYPDGRKEIGREDSRRAERRRAGAGRQDVHLQQRRLLMGAMVRRAASVMLGARGPIISAARCSASIYKAARSKRCSPQSAASKQAQGPERSRVRQGRRHLWFSDLGKRRARRYRSSARFTT
jgi:hypothetical protein